MGMEESKSFIIVACLQLIWSCTVIATSENTQPNIVILLADDLGIGDVGCFGNETIKTPNIDQIASEGAKLTHHLTAASLCTPSRAALLTGRYPIRSGMAAHHIMRVSLYSTCSSGLPANETTFAEVAKKHGYSTALIGKWHLGLHCKTEDYCHHPLTQGFDFFYGLPLTNLKDFGDDGAGVILDHFQHWNMIVNSVVFGTVITLLVLAKYRVLSNCWVIVLLFILLLPLATFYIFISNLKTLNSMVMRNYDFVEQPIHFKNFTQRLVNEGVNFMEQRKQDGKPFLLMMSWLQVHTVLHTSDEFRGHSKHGQYGDNVEEMDWSVGEIVNNLERLGMLNNTFVYFSSDNGGHLEEKGIHGDQEGGWNGIYPGGKAQGGMEGGIRVPTAAMWRGHIRPGTVIDTPTSQMDLFSTLSAAVWSEPLPEDRVIDGRNIYPLLTGQDLTPPHRFMIHYCGTVIHAARYVPGSGHDVYKLYYITPKWLPGTQRCQFVCQCSGRHVIYHNPPLLYNIDKDPSEKNSLPVSQYADIVQLINDAVEKHKNSVEAVPSQFAVLKMLPRPWMQPCCNFPSCTCIDPVYEDIVRGR